MTGPSARGFLPLGVRFILASTLFFSLMSVLVKLAGQGLPVQEIVFARAVVSLVLGYWLVRRAGIPMWGSRRWILVLRGLLGFAAMSCFYFALTRLPIAEATVLHFTSPLWTALLAALLLSEPVTRRILASIAVSFAGVLLITRPGFLFGSAAARIDLMGVGAALLGAMLAAGAYVTVREASKTEHPLVIVFYFPLVMIPATVPFWSSFQLPQGWEWLVLFGVGVSTQIGQVFLTRGLGLEPAARAMTVGYSQIVLVAIWGIIFFEEYLDFWGAVGSLLVIAGTLAVALSRRTPVPGAAHTERAARIQPTGEPA
ncbi:MAG: DMT family transporter [Gemmatimonadota bacterium]|nr:MAG: DMT family transporter [Gemmatimonadota bacterium]